MARIATGFITLTDISDGKSGARNTVRYLYLETQDDNIPDTPEATITWSTGELSGITEGWSTTSSPIDATGVNRSWSSTLNFYQASSSSQPDTTTQTGTIPTKGFDFDGVILFENLNTDTQNIINSVADYDTDISNINTSITDVETDILNIDTDILNVNTDISNINTSITNLDTNLTAIEADVSIRALDSDLQNITQELDNNLTTASERLLSMSLFASEQAGLMRDAGITVDPDNGSVSIQAVEQLRTETDSQFTQVGLELDAVDGQLNLYATRTFVENEIAQAQLDPTDFTAFTDLQARVNQAEIDIDANTASVVLKADQTTLDSLDLRVAQAEIDIDGAEANISLKANQSDFDSLNTRLTSAEVEISAIDGASISQTVSDVSILSDRLDETEAQDVRQLLEIYNTRETLQQDIAFARTQITADVTDMRESIATQRTELGALIDGNSSSIIAEQTARADADSAITEDISQLQADLTSAEGDISGNATAITSLDGRVTTAEGSITSQATDITNLESSVTDLETDTANNATAISSLDTRVTSAEGDITSQSTSITQLQADLTTAQTDITGNTTDIASNSTAITNLDTRVTSAEGTITSQATDITNLGSSITDLETDTSNNATAISGLDTRVTQTETDITTQSTSITNLETSINEKIITFSQDDEPTEGLTDGDLWIDTDDNNKLHRYSGTEWVEIDDSRIADTATALSQLTTTVTDQGGDITAVSQDLLELQTEVEGNTAEILNVAETASSETRASAKRLEQLVAGQAETQLTEIINRENNQDNLNAEIAVVRSDFNAVTNENRESIAQTRTDLVALIDGNSADITSESLARVSSDEALATQINDIRTDLTSAESSIQGNANATTLLQSRVTDNEGDITSISSDIVTLQADIVDADSNISSNSTAISGLDARVTITEDTIVSQSSDITTLESSITDLEADTTDNATAIGGLNTRVTANETSITSQASDITTLQSTVSDLEDSTSSNATAISGLDTRVTATETNVTSQATDITNLESSVTDLETDTLNNANALSQLSTTVTEQGSDITAISQDITTLQTDVAGNTSEITSVAEAASSETSASAKRLEQLVAGQAETQLVEILNRENNQDNLNSEIAVVRSDFNAVTNENRESIAQTRTDLVALIDGNSAYITSESLARVSADEALTSQINNLRTDLTNAEGDIQGNADATTLLTTRVTDNEGDITSISADVTELQASVTDAENDITANGTAITALDTRVTQTETDITSQATDITELESAVTGIQTDITGIQTDVTGNATAITGLGTRVTATETSITSQASDITNLTSTVTGLATDVTGNTTNITTNATAITGLDTRVTATETSITSQASDITTLQSDVTGLTTDTTSNATAITGLDTRVTANETSITSQATAVTTLSTTVGTNTSSISENLSSINGIKAQYSVTLNTNGTVSGFGLISDIIDENPTSAFNVAADQFSIVSPSQGVLWDSESAFLIGDLCYYLGRTYKALTDNTDKQPDISTDDWEDTTSTPFVVYSTDTVINRDGVDITIPAGTYIKDAFVSNLSASQIKTGTLSANRISVDGITLERSGDNLVVKGGGVGTTQLADLAVTDGKIASISADKITAGTIDAEIISANSLAVTGDIPDVSGFITSVAWGDLTGDVPDGIATTDDIPDVSGFITSDDVPANPQWFSLTGRETTEAPSNTDFNTAFSRNPVTGDVLLVEDTSDPVLTKNYQYDGSAWNVITALIRGDMLVAGTLNADDIKTGTLEADRLSIDGVTLDTNASGQLIISDDGVGTTQIADSAVDTTQVASNAVTIPVSVFTSASITMTNSGTVQQATIDAINAPILITFSCILSSSAVFNQSSSSFELYRGTTLLQTYTNLAKMDYGQNTSMSLTYIDTPDEGEHTYYIKSVSPVSLKASARSISLLQVKR